MDLLVLPELSWSDSAAWARTVDFGLGDVPELNIAAFRKKPFVKVHEIPNAQTAQMFAQEQSTLDAAFERIAWIHPSEKDQDIVQFEMSSVAAWEQPIDALTVTGGGSVRGNVLHKLMEELLAGELEEIPEAAQERAAQLIRQLAPAHPPAGLEALELARTALRTFALPELSERNGLVPEVPVYGCIGGNADRLVSGRADAVRYRDGRAQIVFDWKSDVAPEPAVRDAYAHQLSIYVDVLGAARGAVIYMTTGQIDWVGPRRQVKLTS
jgi:CRISPR-associated exonuclease Cas4